MTFKSFSVLGNIRVKRIFYKKFARHSRFLSVCFYAKVKMRRELYLNFKNIDFLLDINTMIMRNILLVKRDTAYKQL